MNTQFTPTAVQENVALMQVAEVEALGNDLKRILVHSEKALMNGDAREKVERLERWIESYRRGLAAAQKISDNAGEMLQKARDQLALALDESTRFEDEGGNIASKEQINEREEIANAIRRIDYLMPVVEQSFQPDTEPYAA